MNYCPNCGQSVNEHQDVCLNCGKSLKNQNSSLNVNDEGGFLWGLVGFFIPILGIILGIIFKKDKPNISKSLLTGAIIGIIIPIIFMILFIFLLPLVYIDGVYTVLLFV